jgi:uncharacterized protein (DUF2236 family)
MGIRERIVTELEAVGGRHDEPELYSSAPGDPGLAGGPGSVSWEVNGDLASVVVGGSAAIIMEVLHPSVMAGVFEQSSYRTEPILRAQNTLGYVLRTTFGTTEAATKVIERVRKVHSHINGTRPDGVPYRALDPELIGWVHTCIPWAVMNAYDRYCRPLSTEEKDRYLTEQSVIGRLGGADWVPQTTAELDDYVEQMAPKMSVNEQTRSFIDFLAGDTRDDDALPARKQLENRLGLRASMSLMPDWARHLTGTYHPALAQRVWFDQTNRLQANLVRWAYPLPCKRLALARRACATAAAAA